MKLRKAVRYAQPSKSVHCNVRCGSRLCENSEIQIACRNSVSVSLILKINCTDGLCREKAIENIFLLVLGFGTFSHSLGQKLKSSMRAHVFCFAPKSGHCATESACRLRAISGLAHAATEG